MVLGLQQSQEAMTGDLNDVDAHQSGWVPPDPGLSSLGLVLMLPGALQSTYILWLVQHTPTFPSALGLAPFHVIWGSPLSSLPLLRAGACQRWCWWVTAGPVSAGITCQGFATSRSFHHGLALTEETSLLP